MTMIRLTAAACPQYGYTEHTPTCRLQLHSHAQILPPWSTYKVWDRGRLPRVHHPVGKPEMGQPPVGCACNPTHVVRCKRPEKGQRSVGKRASSVEVQRECFYRSGSQHAEKGVVLVVPNLSLGGVLFVPV